MARPIVVMSTDPATVELASALIDTMNASQQTCEFSARVDGADVLVDLLASAQDDPSGATQASAPDILTRMDRRRVTVGPFDPFVIQIVGTPLHGVQYRNLFGMHRAEKGVAVFTTRDATRYLPSESSLVAYFLVRYAMSFAAPELKVHDERRGCYFDRKQDKGDILLSASSEMLCHQECSGRLADSVDPTEAAAMATLRHAVARQISTDRQARAEAGGGRMPDLHYEEEVDVKLALGGPPPARDLDRRLPESAMKPLFDLLVAAFDPASLKRMLRFQLQGSEEFIHELPSLDRSDAAFVGETLEVLEQHGVLTERILELISSNRGARQAEVDAIAALLSSA